MSAQAFSSSHAFDDDWQRAVEVCLGGLAIPAGANLGFLYFSDRLSLRAEAMLAQLKAATGIEHWVGSVGVGILSDRGAALDRGGLAVLVGRLPPDGFQVFSGRQPLTPGRMSGPAHFAVVHADPHTPDMPDLIVDMAGKVASGFVTGGLSSSRSRSLQVADDIVTGGISGVVFSAQVGVATRLTQGCVALPGTHLITDAEANVIASIDGRPALDVYRESLPAALRDDLRHAAQAMLVGFPVRGRDRQDYLVRNLVAIDPRSGMLGINGQVEPGQPLLFCRRDPRAAVDDMRAMLERLRESLDSAPRAGLYFSCIARGGNTFDDDASEVRMIAEALGDVPLAGFFCNGEISHDQLYGYTGVLTLLT